MMSFELFEISSLIYISFIIILINILFAEND